MTTSSKLYVDNIAENTTGAGVTITGAVINSANLSLGILHSSSVPVYDVQHPAFGAKGDGVTDDSTALQAAITACQSSASRGIVRLPPGSYYHTQPLVVTANGVIIEGSGPGARYSQNGGSQLLYGGTGAAVRIGNSKIANTTLYDASYSNPDYDGYQFTRVRRLSIKHAAPDTALANGQQSYKLGSIGIQDWRGGNTVVEDVWFENLEYGTWGLQSDFSVWKDCTFIYCRYGRYLGPRSDQTDAYNCQYLLCDTAVWFDRCSAPTEYSPKYVGCGSATTPFIKVLSQYSTGSVDVVLTGAPWFERLQGYVGTMNAFLEIGKGGTVAEGPVLIDHPIFNVQNVSQITNYIAEVGNANRLRITNATGSYNLVAQKLVKFSGSASPIVEWHDVQDRWAASLDTSASTGSPAFHINQSRLYVQPQKSGTYTVTLNDAGLIPFTAASVNGTVTLPAASTYANRPLIIKRSDGSANTLTVVCAGADTYDDGTTSKTIAANSSLRLIPNFPNTGWLVW